MLDQIPTAVTNHSKARTDGVSSSESPCEKPRIANRAPTHRPSRALTRRTEPTSPRIRASATGQIPTGPTFHTVWRHVGRPG